MYLKLLAADYMNASVVSLSSLKMHYISCMKLSSMYSVFI